MGIESIKSVAMSYQGSSRVAETSSSASTVKSASSDVAMTSAELAHNTMAMSTKETSSEGGGNGNMGHSNPEPSQAQIQKAVDEINKKANNSEAVFGVHEKTNRITIKIVDKETKEIIKEFPPDKTLDMIAKVWEMAGLMVDEKR